MNQSVVSFTTSLGSRPSPLYIARFNFAGVEHLNLIALYNGGSLELRLLDNHKTSKICAHIGPITIGYELMVYPTTESNGFVEICAVITQPSDGIAPRDFVVSSKTRDGTASKKLPIHMEQECICKLIFPQCKV